MYLHQRLCKEVSNTNTGHIGYVEIQIVKLAIQEFVTRVSYL